MKNIYYLLLFCFNLNFAQNIEMGGGEYQFNPDKIQCISDENRKIIQARIDKNIDQLKKDRRISSVNAVATSPKFIWPVQKSSTAPYHDVWAISNYVDQNKEFPNKLLDWNCGNRTYDTTDGYNHQGVDIYTWPFSWYQMEENSAVIVAAADGVIVEKYDGNFDRNCAMSNAMWNAVYVRHSDGSVAWYGHMKSGSLTNKAIGDTVKEGEFLGVVGSSGSSTGPHLHFEVYDANNQLVDTYQGNCNHFNNGNNSWWKEQKPYKEPRINAIMTHNAAPQFNTCPQREIPNISNSFKKDESIYIAVYLSDQLKNTEIDIKVYRPDGSVSSNISKKFDIDYNSSYWYWVLEKNNVNMEGKWKFEATYFGVTRTHEFNYGTLSTEEITINDFEIFPNPVKDQLKIQSKKNIKIEKLTLFDWSGKIIPLNSKNLDNIDVSNLHNGVYFLEIKTDKGSFKRKLIKN